jgi:hypothetical protein
MTQSWRHLPAPARPIAAAAVAAVSAARQRDDEALAEAARDLAVLDPALVGLIVGTAVRLLLEDTHPEGLDGDDIRNVLERCVRSAAQWQPDVDPHVVLILLAGALGVHDDGEAPPEPDVLARHAALLIAASAAGEMPHQAEGAQRPQRLRHLSGYQARAAERSEVSKTDLLDDTPAPGSAFGASGEVDERIAGCLTRALGEIERAQLDD